MRIFFETLAIVALILFGGVIGFLVGDEYGKRPTAIDWKLIAPRAVAELRCTKHDAETGEEYHSYASCVVINAETGLALTCAHVVRGAEDMTVDLPNDLTATVRVLVEDDDRDIAIVLLPAHTFTALSLAANDSTALGDAVYEMGFPRDVGLTLTSGIISAIGKDISLRAGKPPMRDLLQHSCPTSPGNSGGPLFDVTGHVLGINVAMNTGAACVAYTIPVSQLREELALHDYVLHVYR